MKIWKTMLAGASAIALLAAQGARAEVREVYGYAFAYPGLPVSEELEDEDAYLDRVRREADVHAMFKCFGLRGQPVPLSDWELLFPGLYTSRACHILMRRGTLRHECWASATRECRLPDPGGAPPVAANVPDPRTDASGQEGASAESPYEGAGGASAGD